MMNKEKNKKVALTILGIIILVVMVLGISYAAFNYTGKGEVENAITTGTITMVYTEGDNGITLSNAIPMEDEVGKQLKDDNQMFDFTVQINIVGNTTISYEVTAEKQTDSTLQNNEVRIYLERSTDKANYNAVSNEVTGYVPLEEADSFGAKVGEMVLDTGSTSTTATYYYRLRMWVSKSYELTEESKHFTIKVNVYGSDGVKVTSRYLKEFGKDTSNANKPELVGDMIPVVWDEKNKTWVKSPTNQNNYYNYENQNWANAVTIKETDKRAEYKSAPIGTEVKMTDINTMWVWIPRYSYALKGDYGTQIGETTPNQNTPGAFDIKFVNTSTTDTGAGKYTVDNPGGYYYTPSSFCWGNTCDDEGQRSNENTELSGIWISKFEMTGSLTEITSKPNETSITNQTNQSFFNAIQTQMNNTNGSTNYGFNGNNYDTHMIKNTEWGAMAYLSQSKYGKYGNKNYTGVNKEIYINDYSGLQTGCSKGAPGSGTSGNSNKSDTCEHQYMEPEPVQPGRYMESTILWEEPGNVLWEITMMKRDNQDLNKCPKENIIINIQMKRESKAMPQKQKERMDFMKIIKNL